MPDRKAVPSTSVLFGSGCLFVFGLVVFLFAAGIAATILTVMRGSVAAGLVALAIALSFAAAGIVLMVMAWRTPAAAREQRARQARHPNQPWLWREDWEQGFVRANGRSHATFRMASVPGVLGGKLRGCVETLSPAAQGQMEVVLECVLWRWGYRTGWSQTLWQDRTTARLYLENNGAQAMLELNIPFDTRATGDVGPGSTDRVFWRLSARSVDGVFHASFTVPVFQTADSDPHRTRERMEAQAGDRLGGYAPVETRIQKVNTPEGIRYRFPRGRHWSMGVIGALFGLIFLGIAFVLALQVRSGLALGAIFGTLLSAMIGFLGLAVAVWLWFRETTVLAATGELRMHGSCLGVSHTRVVHADQIRGVEIEPGMQKGARVWYDVWVRDAAGTRSNAGTGMDKTEAEWFVAEIRRDLGLR